MAGFGMPAAAAIQAPATIAAADIAADAQRDANRKNLQGVKETNETNIRLAREQREYDLQMWQMNNLYNSPEEQMKRLQDAGVNPLVAFGGSNPTGVSPQSAGGQVPAQAVPANVIPEDGAAPYIGSLFQNLASAYKDIQAGQKDKSETNLTDFEYESVKKMALEGLNIHEIQTNVALETYNKMKTENKWIDEQIKWQIRSTKSEISLRKIQMKERKEACNVFKQQAKSLALENKFNAQSLPDRLRKLTEEINTIIQDRKNSIALTDANVGLINAQKDTETQKQNLLSEQTELTKAQTDSELQKVIEQKFLNGLRDLGIDPNRTDVPFFAGIAMKLYKGEITAAEVSDYFEFLTYGERVGWNKVAKSSANLTKYSLMGNPSGIMGSGVDLRSMLNILVGITKSNPTISH